jgi:hypothetical protein
MRSTCYETQHYLQYKRLIPQVRQYASTIAAIRLATAERTCSIAAPTNDDDTCEEELLQKHPGPPTFSLACSSQPHAFDTVHSQLVSMPLDSAPALVKSWPHWSRFSRLSTSVVCPLCQPSWPARWLAMCHIELESGENYCCP